MVAIANAEILNSYPVIQLAAGALVVIVGVYLTLRAASDNKRTAHIAQPGHDPLGLTVLANGMVGTLASILEILRGVLITLNDIRVAVTESNNRLEQLHDSHHNEMSHLRDTVEGKRPPRKHRPRPSET